MPSRAKFQEIVEQRMRQFDDVLRKLEPLSRGYEHDPEDVKEMLYHMRLGIDKIEALFSSGGKRGGFRFSTQSSNEARAVTTDQDLEIPPSPDVLTQLRTGRRT